MHCYCRCSQVVERLEEAQVTRASKNKFMIAGTMNNKKES